jgi:lysophospholipase L1-like esterase
VAADPHSPFDGLTFLACSGATARNLLVASGTPAEQYPGQGTQIGELESILHDDPGFKPALVVVGVGGNDAGFSRLGQTCLAPGSCSDPHVSDLFTRRMPEVEASVKEVFEQLHELLPSTTILAVPYPMPITAAATCNGVPLELHERLFIRSFLTALDSSIQQAAKATQTYYLAQMRDAMVPQHLQLCDPANHDHPGINFLKLKGTAALASASAERFDPAKWIHDSLHPNVRGHAAMAQVLRAWDSAHPDLLGNSDTRVGQVTPVLASKDTRNAELKGANTWALDQVRDTWPWVLLVMVGAAGLWVAVVAGYVLVRPEGGGVPASPRVRGSGSQPDRQLR